MAGGYTYLASPYSHENDEVRKIRFNQACNAAAILMKQGHKIFCPIAHSHPIGEVLSRQCDFDFWKNQDMPLLRHADKVIVLMLPGWEHSKGIKQETDLAMQIGIPVTYLHYTSLLFGDEDVLQHC